MAPRGRGRHPKKNTRMAAAIENMVPMGFEESLIKSTVQELLKIYTEDAWVFIEENSYQVLLEALLEKTSEPQAEQEHETQEKEGGHEIALVESTAGSSNLAAIGTQGNTVTEDIEGEAPPLLLEPPRTRQPYYGWISRDEAAGGEIIELPPMPLSVFEAKWRCLPLESELDLESDLDLDEP